MRANDYKVAARCVEEGINYGWQRAHKHTETPGEETIKEEIESAVMNALSEAFTWDEAKET